MRYCSRISAFIVCAVLSGAAMAQNSGAETGASADERGRIGIQPLPMAQIAALKKEQIAEMAKALDAAGAPEKDRDEFIAAVKAARKLKLTGGLFIAAVVKDGPAEKAGIKPGDVLVGIGKNDYREDAAGFNAAMAKLKVGKKTKFMLLRGGEEQTVELIPISAEELQKLSAKSGGGGQPAAPEAPMNLELGFDDVAEGTLMENWKARRTGEGATAEWQVVTDENAQKGKQVLTIMEPANEAETLNLCMYEPVRYDAVVMQAYIRIDKGDKARRAGVVLRAKNSKNYYAVVADGKTNELIVLKVVDGQTEEIGKKAIPKTDADFSPGNWNRLEVEQGLTRIICRVNAATGLAGDVRDDTHKRGKSGFVTMGDTVAQFDSVIIQKIEKPAAGGS